MLIENEQQLGQIIAAAWAAMAGSPQGQSYKAAGSSPSYTYAHGPGGLFSAPGLGNPIFSALVLPDTGLASRIPAKAAEELTPLYGLLTGMGASTGSNPDGVCDDPPTTGLLKFCTQMSVFGRLSRQTPTLDLDRIGRRINRAEQMDLKLLNNPLMTANPLIPTMPVKGAPAQALRYELNKLFLEFGAAWTYDFAPLTYTGNPTNNTTNKGYMEFRGLEMLVNTGKVDAITNTACNAADSRVVDFSNANITGAGNAANAQALLARIVYEYRYLTSKARRNRLAPVSFKFVMQEALFYEISAFWPCVYNTNQCATVITDSNAIVNIDGKSMVQDRDEMRQNRYLLIDGEKVEVIFDDSVPYTANGALTDPLDPESVFIYDGTYTSDIYILPFTVLGGIDVLYWEYIDYDMDGGAMAAAKILAPGDNFFTSDSGRFFWTKKTPVNFCVQFLSKTEPRLRLDTPQLATRIENIKYQPLVSPVSPWRDDPNYLNGGVSTYADFTAGYTIS